MVPDADKRRIGLTAVLVAALLVFACHFWLSPAPLSVSGVAGGFLLGALLFRSRAASFLLAGVFLLLAISAHVYSHVVESRVGTIDELMKHAAEDALIGVLLGGLIALAAVAADRFVQEFKNRPVVPR